MKSAIQLYKNASSHFPMSVTPHMSSQEISQVSNTLDILGRNSLKTKSQVDDRLRRQQDGQLLCRTFYHEDNQDQLH